MNLLIKFINLTIPLTMLMLGLVAQAQDSTKWSDGLKEELQKVYPQAEIEIQPSVHWVKGGDIQVLNRFTFLGDDSKGNAHFRVVGVNRNDIHEGWVPYSAWMEGQVAIRKIKPGETLKSSFFIKKKLNVAYGLGREIRALMLAQDTPVENLESIRTILEGQPLLSSAVEQVPDVRRGDWVKVFIKSGGLFLSTSGTAQESGYQNKKIRILTSQGKRELQGVLQAKNLVEVEL